MYALEAIRTLHLELTTRCNARCPMCPRNLSGGRRNPLVDLADLSLANIEQVFEPPFVQQLHKIYLCGNHGDPAAARDALPILQYFRSHQPKANLGFHTNGGVRPPAWWAELASVVSSCRFGIDGLEDTNHLYRQGVGWPTLMRNVEAFIAAGGVAEWAFLVFRHNEHQLDAAHQLSRRLGFSRFEVKMTSRFLQPRGTASAQSFDVLSPAGRLTHRLEPPNDPLLNHSTAQKHDELRHRWGSMTPYLESCAIDCKALAERSLYVNAQGLALPCCWMAGELHRASPPPWVQRLGSHPGGLEAISVLRHGLRAVVESPFFQKETPAGWAPGALGNPRIEMCAKTCGGELRPFEGQFHKQAASAPT